MPRRLDVVKLRSARRAAGFRTQRSLAERVGLAENTVGRMERGQFVPGPAAVARVAAALGVDLESLYLTGPAIGVEDLTPDELELLRSYRKLSAGHGDFVVALALGLANKGALDAAVEAARLYAELCQQRRAAQKPG